MNSKNMTFTVVQNRSNLPTIFTMSNQPTPEKSLSTSTHESPSGSLINSQPENAATEVANTLVSMAAGQQRATTIPNVKRLDVITVPNTSTSLPVLSLADYTTSLGVPTAIALATQANLVGRNLDENAMSTDEMTDASNQSNSTTSKTRRNTKTKSSTNKIPKSTPVEPIQYGPIVVKPRKHVAPTLANGRKSKDEMLPPDEDLKRKQRRDRNKDAAAKCRRKRNELREQLEKTEQALVEQQKALEMSVQSLADHKNQLEHLLHRHPCTRKSSLPITTMNNGKIDLKTMPTTSAFTDGTTNPINTKRVTINFSNPNDLLAVAAPLARSNSIGGETVVGTTSNVPMITIHIVPEIAQALLGSTSLDRTKLIELLQQATATATTTSNTSSTSTNSTAS